MKTEKRVLFSAVALAILFMAFFCGIAFAGVEAYAEVAADFEKTTSVMHLTDIHVMPPEYSNEYSDAYQKSMAVSKLIAESGSALQSSLDEIYKMENAPMYVVLSGDLTSNGEYQAHVYVSDTLKKFTAAMRKRKGYEGFQIFVVPGNHDMYNFNSSSFMPTEEEAEQCETEEELRELLKNYSKRSVRTTTNDDFYALYSDFGYCDCTGRKAGHHQEGCGMVEGCKLNFFYESEYWFEENASRDTTFKVKNLTKKEEQEFKDSDLNFEVIADKARLGACSYIAEIDGITFLGIDGNARKYSGDNKTVAQKSASGWCESTGGVVTDDQLRWLISETRDDVARNNLILANCHFNVVPHFETEDDLISLFLLDNWDKFSYTMANNGIRYAFTGHQHANDIVDFVTQQGNVLYDIETGSTITYGSAYRVVNFIQSRKNGVYTEDVKSTVYSLAGNCGSDVFSYQTYKIASEVEEPIEVNIVNEYFGEEETDLFGGKMKLCRSKCTDINDKECGIGDYLTKGMSLFISMDGIAGSFVNDGLYNMLRGVVGKIGNDYKFLKSVLAPLIEGVEKFDFYEIIPNKNNTDFKLSDKPKKGNDAVNMAKAFLTYLFEYDFSYGTIEGKVKLSELYVEIYGGHLSGAHGTEGSSKAKPVLEKLQSGEFVRFIINLLADAIIPQIDLLFNAPIRFDVNTPELGVGEGFDITSRATSGGSVLDNVIKNLIETRCFKNVDERGYSSVKYLLKDIVDSAEELLLEDLTGKDNTTKFIGNALRGFLSGVNNIDGYVYLVMEYLNKYFDNGSLYEVVQVELMDKYVTDALCRNLGLFLNRVFESLDKDDTKDGTVWLEGVNMMIEYRVVNEKDFNVTTTKNNGEEIFGGHAYVGGSKLTVNPTKENGLMPSLVNLTFGDDPATTKNIRWFTSVEEDVMMKNSDGKFEFGVPKSYIKYSESKDMKSAKIIKADSENYDRELPTIDLGVLYVNLTHRYKLYNRHNVNLKDLKSGTTYYYMLGSDEYGWTEVRSFTTEKNGYKDGYHFLAMSDIQGSVKENYIESLPYLQKAKECFESGAEFIVSCGDNVDYGKNIMQYHWWLDEQEEIWSNSTIIGVAGNHEDSHYALSEILALPDGAKVDETGFYYSYNYGMVHYVLLNTNDLGENGLSDEQTEWLEEDLDKANGDRNISWTIVIMHKGPYTAGSHAFDSDVISLRKQLTPIFAEKGVDLVLQGHDHTFSVSEFIGSDGKPVDVKYDSKGQVVNPNGVLYINLGTMGDKFYNYIYSEEVYLQNRLKVNKEAEPYLSDEGKLELTKTPAFADVFVNDGKLVIKAYTIIDGKAVEIFTNPITIVKNNEIDWNNLEKEEIITLVVLGSVVALSIVFFICGFVRRKK